ncbi:MAG TPA: translation initiation factor [Chloroflexia bacterium]|nr:translation initiation factor [Chloroflexia bacterium]
MKKQIPQGTRVYSTDPDPLPPPPPEAPGPPPQKQTARVWRDSKRRRGKTVTVIGGLQHNRATYEELLLTLKKKCGAGGTFKPEDNEIEIQGDHRETVTAYLQQLGYKVKAVGG